MRSSMLAELAPCYFEGWRKIADDVMYKCQNTGGGGRIYTPSGAGVDLYARYELFFLDLNETVDQHAWCDTPRKQTNVSV